MPLSRPEGRQLFPMLLTIGAKAAQWLNLTTSMAADAEAFTDASAPTAPSSSTGASFADVAGGATVYNSTTGDTYVVGATRASPARAT